MSLKSLNLIFYGLVLVGLADSMYLSMTVFLNIAPTCGALHGCETVAASSYSRLFGIPLAYLGTLYYALGAVLGGYLRDSKTARLLALIYSLTGALMSAWFVYIQAARIGAFCVYCLISSAAAFLLLITTYFLFKKGKEM